MHLTKNQKIVEFFIGLCLFFLAGAFVTELCAHFFQRLLHGGCTICGQSLLGDSMFSVIIPNFNHGKYLGRAIMSLAAQQFKPKEVIIIDDGSTDFSPDIIHSFVLQYPDWIKAVYLQDNTGNPSLVANIGLDLCSQPFVTCMSADDEMLPSFLSEMKALIELYPQAKVCSAVAKFNGADGLRWLCGKGLSQQSAFFTPEQCFKLACKGKLPVSPSCVVWSTECVRNIKGWWKESESFSDCVLAIILCLKYGVAFSPKCLAIFNENPNSYYHRTIENSALVRKAIRDTIDKMEVIVPDTIDSIKKTGFFGTTGPRLSLLLELLSRRKSKVFLTWRLLLHVIKRCYCFYGRKLINFVGFGLLLVIITYVLPLIILYFMFDYAAHYNVNRC